MSIAGYNTQQRGNGPYFLHIENLPRKYTWQDLKDLIRKVAAHGLWTEMAVLPNGQPGGKGYGRVQRVDEAYKLYNYLTENIIENRSLRVHLWDISTAPAVFVRCNCGNKPQSHPPSDRIAQMAIGPGWQTFNAMSPMPMAQPSPYPNPAIAMSPPMPMPMPLAVQANEQQIVAAMQRMRLDPREPSHRAQFTQIVNSRYPQQAQAGPAPPQFASPPPPPPAQAMYPMYIPNTTGAPVNTSHGLIKTEARGIFISNLNFKSREREIESYFSKAGPIVRVDLQKDSNGKSKGNATIQYATAEAAQKAVQTFHKGEFMRMILNVRADRERTVINAPAAQASAGARRAEEPTIVNGSQAPRKDSAVSGLPFKG